MRIVDCAYFGWELEVGSSISRDLFVAARIRPRVLLDAGLLRVRKKIWWRSDERLDHHSWTYFWSILTNQVRKGVKQRTMDLWDPSTEMHSVKAGMVGQ